MAEDFQREQLRWQEKLEAAIDRLTDAIKQHGERSPDINRTLQRLDDKLDRVLKALDAKDKDTIAQIYELVATQKAKLKGLSAEQEPINAGHP